MAPPTRSLSKEPRRAAPGLALAAALLSLLAANQGRGEEVVVYAALDREFSEPILDQFEQETGIDVRAVYDIESTKTVGLATRLMNERRRPRCDVFWNNEILHTLRLQREGLLARYVPPRAEQFPDAFRSPEGYWHGLAARARVIVVNTQRLPGEHPTSVEDLADPRWCDSAGIAKPLFGTTATHAAVLLDRWGRPRAERFFDQVSQRVRVLSGNKQVALAVSQGLLAWGLTDTDDAIIEIDAGRPVKIVFPDQGEGGMGTLLIPNTLSIIKGGPHPEAARRLVDFLLRAEVERQLARGPSAQFPLGSEAQDVRSRAQGKQPLRWMEADFAAAARQWEAASAFLRRRFSSPPGPDPAGLVLVAVGFFCFATGLLNWGLLMGRLPLQRALGRGAARVVCCSAGLLLAAAGWWLVVG